MIQRWCLAVLVLAIFLVAQGLVGDVGNCTLFVYVPLTYAGFSTSFIVTNDTNTSTGFNHMAGALLAIEHFNNRDGSIVPELAELQGCPVYFDEIEFFDTQSVGHFASRSFTDQPQVPCAIAGPFNDMPGLDLGSLAQAHEIPLVAHRAFNNRICSQQFNPFSSQVFPDLEASSENLFSFLLEMNRTNYTSFLYPATDSGTQRREAFTYLMEQNDMRWFAQPYRVSMDNEESIENMKDALKRVKDRGYRTIIFSTDDPLGTEIIPLAFAAQELEMSNGDYFWILWGQDIHFDDVREHIGDLDDAPIIWQLLAGMAWLVAGENYFIDPETDPFYNAWQQSDTDFVDRLNQVNPISPGEPGYVFAKPDFFDVVFPEWGTGLMADAVFSIGIGACSAAQEATNITGQQHLEGIRRVSFRGASGTQVRFSPDSLERPGTRDPNTTLWAAMNYRYENASNISIVQIISGLREGLGEWWFPSPFLFADGTTNPPELRDEPNQNYLSRPLRAFGLSLMSITIFLAVLTMIWVFVNRKHAVLLAAQPIFLYLVAFGSIVFVSAIFTLSWDESYGASETQMDRLCAALPWLTSLGDIIIYGALYSKLWRVNRVLQFTRRRVGFWRAMIPFLIILLLTLVALTVGTVYNPSRWSREVINDDTGESIGRCSDGVDGLALLLALIMTLMTGIYAWKTRDVDSAYSESWWIFMLILLHFEVLVVAIPLIVILGDVSRDGAYFGYVIIIWIVPMSTLALIFLPKVMAHYKAIHGITQQGLRGSGGHGTVQVTGVSASRASPADATALATSLETANGTTSSAASHAEETVASLEPPSGYKD